MRRRGLRVVLVSLATMLLGAGGIVPSPHPHADTRPVVERAPADVLRDYLAALAALRRPKALSFDYTVSQLGLRNMEQTHRVYRGGLDERDETLVVDGYTLKAPAVRVLRNQTYRYDVTTVAPRLAQYTFAYDGAGRASGPFSYRFRTIPRSARAFRVVEIEIDGRTLLPALVRFRIAGGGARGEGTLRYGRSDTHWVVREARVTAKLRNGTTARERIVWSNYRFYDALPRGTFEAPKSIPIGKPTLKPTLGPTPIPTPTPTPTTPAAPVLR